MFKNLFNYYLTEPVNKDGEPTGLARTVRDLKYYDSPYFTPLVSSIFFSSYDKAAVTKSAKYGRSELHGTIKYGLDVPLHDRRKVIVHELPKDQKACLAQFHDGNSPITKDEFDNKGPGKCTLRAAVKINGSKTDDVYFLLADNLRLGEMIDIRKSRLWDAKKEQWYLKYTVNGKTKRIWFNKYDFKPAHIQFGVYYQSNAAKGNVCVVEHFVI